MVRGLGVALLVFVALGIALAGPAAAQTGGPGTDAADLGLVSVDAPDEVAYNETLTVAYTVENTGTDAGTESFVDLLVDGDVVDTDEDVTVQPGETVNGTLAFDKVYSRFEPGDTIPLAVELFETGEAVGAETSVAETNGSPETPDIEVASLEYPDQVAPDGDLTVEYTLTNVGGADGTESFVDLIVDGQGIIDFAENVTVPAGGSVSGTLTYPDVSTDYAPGETIGFEVALWDFATAETGATSVAPPGELELTGLEYPEEITIDETLTVTYTIANVGDAVAIESVVALGVGQSVEDSQEVDRDEDVTVPAGETVNGTLTFEDIGGVFDPGDSLGLGVGLLDFDEQLIGQIPITETADTGGLALAGVDAPAEVAADESLEVTYTLRNSGDTAVTEESVTLLVEGSQVVSHENVTVGAGANTTNTFVYEAVGETLTPGETLAYTVVLSTAGESETGEIATEGQESGEASLALAAVQTPGQITVGESLEVTYTIENSGSAPGTEEGVSLLVDGDQVATHSNVTVEAGASTSDTLEFEAVEAVAETGETVSYTLSLSTVGDSATGEITTAEQDQGEPELELSVDAPDEISLEESLEVGYTLENVGNATTTETAVELVIGGDTIDTDDDVVLNASETRNGTLVFDAVEEQYSEGGVIQFTVELATDGATASGTTDVGTTDDNETTGGEADIQLVSVEAPDVVGPDEDLTVSFTLENVGNETGTESFIDFSINGGVFQTAEDVTVPAGETETGFFEYRSVSYELGDTLEYAIELADFDESASGQVSVGTADQSGSLSLGRTVRTDSATVAINVTALDTIDGSGWVGVQNLDNDAGRERSLVGAGDLVLARIEDIGGVSLGDTVQVTLAVDSEFTEVLDTRTTTVQAGDNAPIASFTSEPGAPVVGQPVVFNAESTRGGGSGIVEYRWDLTGDGEFDEVTTTPVVDYTFETASVQEVRLVVENEVGLTAEETTQIAVQEDTAPAESSLSLLSVGGEGPAGTVEAGGGSVSVLVTNVGEETGSFEVELSVGLDISRTQVTGPLEGGSEQEVTFEDVAGNLDPGLYTLDVSTANDSVSGELTVEQEQVGPGPEPAFTVDLVETNSPVVAGGNLTATVEVSNTGDREGTATVTLDVGTLGSTTGSLTVGSGESATETLTLGTTAGDAGEYNATADVGESETSFTVTVNESGDGGGGPDETDDGLDGGLDETDDEPGNGTAADEDGTLVTPTLVFLLLLVLSLVGGTYYYVNESDQSDGMDPL